MVLDVGAHTGAFTCACLMRGTSRVVACEPDPDSFALLQRNVARLCESQGGLQPPELRNTAGWRSDRTESVWLTSAQFSELTGCLHPAAQAVLTEPRPDAKPVATVGLDQLLESFERVSLLKLDCEGAEWPILFTSKRLDRVQRLVMEVHSLAWKSEETRQPVPVSFQSEFGHLTFDDLRGYLENQGLHCVRANLQTRVGGNAAHYFGQAAFERSCQTCS